MDSARERAHARQSLDTIQLKCDSLKNELFRDGENQESKLSNAEILNRKIERFGLAHRRSSQMAAYMCTEVSRIEDRFKRNKFYKVAERMQDCGAALIFREYIESGELHLKRANFCAKYYLCPFCAILRAGQYTRRYIERLDIIMRENQHPRLVPYFVTLTVKNGYDLRERFNHLKKSFRAYQDQMRQGKSRGQHYNELNRVAGAVYSIETTWDAKNNTGWHPHIHMVALCEEGNELPDFRDMDADEKKASSLAQEWGRICGDSFIVDSRPFDMEKDAAKSFSEVFKYALKFSEMSLGHNLQAAVALYGSRLVGSFGLFRGVEVPENDATPDLEDMAFFETIFGWQNGHYEKLRRDFFENEPAMMDLGAEIIHHKAELEASDAYALRMSEERATHAHIEWLERMKRENKGAENAM